MEMNEIKGGFSGIGLSNVHQRIKLLFGEGYGLELFSKEGRGTNVITSYSIHYTKLYE